MHNPDADQPLRDICLPVRSSRQLHPATPRQGVPANPVSRTGQAGLAHEGLRGEPTANLDQGGYSRPSRRRHARGDGLRTYRRLAAWEQTGRQGRQTLWRVGWEWCCGPTTVDWPRRHLCLRGVPTREWGEHWLGWRSLPTFRQHMQACGRRGWMTDGPRLVRGLPPVRLAGP